MKSHFPSCRDSRIRESSSCPRVSWGGGEQSFQFGFGESSVLILKTRRRRKRTKSQNRVRSEREAREDELTLSKISNISVKNWYPLGLSSTEQSYETSNLAKQKRTRNQPFVVEPLNLTSPSILPSLTPKPSHSTRPDQAQLPFTHYQPTQN